MPVFEALGVILIHPATHAALIVGLLSAELAQQHRLSSPIYSKRETLATLTLIALSLSVASFYLQTDVYGGYIASLHQLSDSVSASSPLAIPQEGIGGILLCLGIALVWVDLQIYIFHRWMHMNQWGWSLHEVHHQSTDYHILISPRQSPFYYLVALSLIPLANFPLSIFGIKPALVSAVFAFEAIWFTFQHTSLVKRMPDIIEGILATPSNHRVHHGRNPQYVDKNFGGFFILWDRIFGTYEPEVERPVYGISPPVGTANPLKLVWSAPARAIQSVHRISKRNK